MVCHLFIATNQVSPFLRQLRSITNRCFSPSNASRTASNLSSENLPLGNRKDVMITYYPVLTRQHELDQNDSYITSMRKKRRAVARREGNQMWQRLRGDEQTFSAPASIQVLTLPSVIPPPTCKPPGHSANAPRAASSFPGPSIITCAPAARVSLYNRA